MPYTLDVYDSTQPTQTDEGATLGGEVRAIKALVFGSRSVITGNVAADQSSNGLVYKHTEATARDFSCLRTLRYPRRFAKAVDLESTIWLEQEQLVSSRMVLSLSKN